MNLKNKKIYISGHNGMVGSSCWRILKENGYNNLIGKSSDDLDLRNQKEVDNYILKEKPFLIINAAARVGGILANSTYPYEFLMENMQIQNNLINSSFKYKVSKFIFLGSSCIYPKFSKQPIKEDYLLSGNLEPTNEWYAIAKISGVKAIESLKNQYNKDYVSLMPTNLYGPNDNFSLNSSHVLPALIRKFHDAKEKKFDNVKLWGTGNPKREFLYVDDLSNAILFIIENNFKKSIYNVGTGEDISIKKLALLIKKIVGFEGEIFWDESKPDGTPRKLLNINRLKKLGWNPSINLEEGIIKTYNWYKKNINEN